MAGLEGLPGWALKLHENVGRFSSAGLTGLVDHAGVTNGLGEMLARGEVNPERVKEFLDGLRKPAVAEAATRRQPDLFNQIRVIWDEITPQNFWGGLVWPGTIGEQVMRDRKIIVPPFPRLKQKTMEAITGGLGTWMPIFLPNGLTEEDYPESFIKPDWGKRLTVANIQRRPLPGRWVLVETIQKPDYTDLKGYGNGNDPLAQAIGLPFRFEIPWNTLKNSHLPAAAKLLGLSKKAVRLPTAEEWNLIGNLFLWLNKNRNMNLPDLGSTNSWEWCENTYGGGDWLLVGSRGCGGLAGVSCRWFGRVFAGIGFRVLAVL